MHLPNMITVSNLSKVFRTEKIENTALNSVSFEIKDGERVAIARAVVAGLKLILADEPSAPSTSLTVRL